MIFRQYKVASITDWHSLLNNCGVFNLSYPEFTNGGGRFFSREHGHKHVEDLPSVEATHDFFAELLIFHFADGVRANKKIADISF